MKTTIKNKETGFVGTIEGYVSVDEGFSCPKYIAAVVLWDENGKKRFQTIRLHEINDRYIITTE